MKWTIIGSPKGFLPFDSKLTHWGRVTHICVDKLTIIGSDNGLSPDRRQAIIWTNAGLLSIRSLRTYFNENLIMHVKMSSAKWRPSCPGLNVLMPGPMIPWPMWIGPLVTFSKITFKVIYFFFMKIHLETASVIWRQSCPVPDLLNKIMKYEIRITFVILLFDKNQPIWMEFCYVSWRKMSRSLKNLHQKRRTKICDSTIKLNHLNGHLTKSS